MWIIVLIKIYNLIDIIKCNILILILLLLECFILHWQFYDPNVIKCRYMMSSLCKQCLLAIVHNFKIWLEKCLYWLEHLAVVKKIDSYKKLLHTCSFNHLLQWFVFLIWKLRNVYTINPCITILITYCWSKVIPLVAFL